MSRVRLLVPVVALAAWFAPALARAQVCSFSSGPTAINFTYDPAAAAATDSSGTFVFDCTGPGNPKVTVLLSAGAGTFAQRQMVLGTDRLNYNLYQDPARSIIWGDGTPPSQTDTNSRRRKTYTIYGRIPAGQFVATGTYSDTITVTLLY